MTTTAKRREKTNMTHEDKDTKKRTQHMESYDNHTRIEQRRKREGRSTEKDRIIVRCDLGEGQGHVK